MEHLLDIHEDPLDERVRLRLVEELVAVLVRAEHADRFAPDHQAAFLDAELDDQDLVVDADVTADFDEVEAFYADGEEAREGYSAHGETDGLHTVTVQDRGCVFKRLNWNGARGCREILMTAVLE
jgi:hypothetical protein